MIYCVWYPSGGFGHFVNGIITLFGQGFRRPQRKLTFSSDGNSHSLDLVAPAYCHDPLVYQYKFDNSHNHCVLIDNGITNESTRFLQFFPGAKVIKMCYDHYSWPVLAYTMIHKAMVSDLDTALALDADKWSGNEAWMRREKYFLFLKDHPIGLSWRASDFCTNIRLQDLLIYHKFNDMLTSAGIELDDFSQTHADWLEANQKYFDPVQVADKFIHGNFDQPIVDLWTQAIVYYQIWQQFGVVVPHNDFADFFVSSAQFRDWLESAR